MDHHRLLQQYKAPFGNAVQTTFHKNFNFFFLLKINIFLYVLDGFDAFRHEKHFEKQ